MVAACCAFNVSPAFAQQSVTVNGHASVAVAPNQLEFHIQVEEKGALLSKLSKTLDVKTKKVLEELLDSDIPKEHIQSLNLSVFPWYERENNQSVQKGFVVSRQINVKLEDFAKLDGLIDKILRVGVKSIGGFRHSVKDEDNIYRDALALAVKDAQKNAKAMLDVVGKKLGPVLSLTQSPNSGHQPMSMRYAMAKASSPYTEGQMNVNAAVMVEFAITD